MHNMRVLSHFIWGKMRTSAQEITQIALRDWSKEAVGEGQFIRYGQRRDFSPIKHLPYKRFLLVGWFTMKGFCDFSRYEEIQRLDNYLKTCSPVSLEHRVPHSPPWIPLRGCWRSTAAAAKGSAVTIQFSRSVMSDSLQPHGRQHARLPCPPRTPGASSNSCLLSQWCQPTISSSVIPFSCL